MQQDRVDLARLIRHLVADPTGPCDKLGLTTIVQVPETPVWLSIGRDELEAIVSELLWNARESIDMSGTIEISLTHTGRDAAAVAIAA